MKIRALACPFLASFSFLVTLAHGSPIETNTQKGDIKVNNTNMVDGVVWGQPTNGVSIGIKFLNPLGRSGNKSDTAVYILNIGRTNGNSGGQTNSRRLWLAPHDFQRVSLSLFDSSGKSVHYLATYHPSIKIYKTMSEVPKNVHGVRDGAIPLNIVGLPIVYELVALQDIFKLEHGGDYTLVAKGRIMRINSDSSLSLMEIPPVSLPIHISGADVGQK